MLADLHQAIKAYFNILRRTGYKKYSQVDDLLLLSAIEGMLNGPMAEFVTEEDFRSIDKALYCLYGKSCMIPYPSWKKALKPLIKALPREIRITEDELLRCTEKCAQRERI